MTSSLRSTDQPAGERLVSPNVMPDGAFTTTLVMSTFFSLAAERMKNVGVCVLNRTGLISSCAHAGAAGPTTSATTSAHTCVFMERLLASRSRTLANRPVPPAAPGCGRPRRANRAAATPSRGCYGEGMTSAPRMYGASASGMRTEPSGCRHVSTSAAHTLGVANADPFTVWSSSVPRPPLGR